MRAKMLKRRTKEEMVSIAYVPFLCQCDTDKHIFLDTQQDFIHESPLFVCRYPKCRLKQKHEWFKNCENQSLNI